MPILAIEQLGNGFVGQISRNYDWSAHTRKNGSGTVMPYGVPVMWDRTATVDNKVGVVTNISETFTADDFAGITVDRIQSAFTYGNTEEIGGAAYRVSQEVAVLNRGGVLVLCEEGTPYPDAPVYIRTVADTTNGYAVGTLTTENVTGETVLIPTARFNGFKDTLSRVEVVLINRASV